MFYSVLSNFNTSLLTLSKTQKLIVRWKHFMDDIFKNYTKDGSDILNCWLLSEYKDVSGHGIGGSGTTKDIFATFWYIIFDQNENFCGENAKVPKKVNIGSRRHTDEQWRMVGAILSHYVAITCRIPVKFCRSTLMYIINKNAKIPDEVLINDLLLYLTESERKLLTQALTNYKSLTEDQEECLVELYGHHGLPVQVTEKKLKTQLVDLARHLLIEQPSYICGFIREGIPDRYKNELWMHLNIIHLTIMYSINIPNAERLVRELIRTNEANLKPDQHKVFYFLKETIKSFDRVMLEKFLHFTTGLNLMPTEPITVSFVRVAGYLRAHACANNLELSTIYDSQQAFQSALVAVLNNEDYYVMKESSRVTLGR